MSEWISVKKIRPFPYCGVMALWQHEKDSVNFSPRQFESFVNYEKESWHIDYASNKQVNLEEIGYRVTHWQPLRSLPED